MQLGDENIDCMITTAILSHIFVKSYGEIKNLEISFILD